MPPTWESVPYAGASCRGVRKHAGGMEDERESPQRLRRYSAAWMPASRPEVKAQPRATPPYCA